MRDHCPASRTRIFSPASATTKTQFLPETFTIVNLIHFTLSILIVYMSEVIGWFRVSWGRALEVGAAVKMVGWSNSTEGWEAYQTERKPHAKRHSSVR